MDASRSADIDTKNRSDDTSTANKSAGNSSSLLSFSGDVIHTASNLLTRLKVKKNRDLATNMQQKSPDEEISEHNVFDDGIMRHVMGSSFFGEGASWHDQNFTLSDRMLYLHDNQLGSDVIFYVGPTEVQVTAHKFVLSIASPIFEVMFTRDEWKSTDPIGIPDADVDAFRRLIKFAYTDSIALNSECVMAVLYLAKKYLIRSLECLCIEYLTDNLTTQNAFALLDQAKKFDISFLVDLCLKVIDDSTVQAIESDSFLDVSISTLDMVFSRDKLRATELAIFNALYRWAKTACKRSNLNPTPENLRSLLGDTIYRVRMTCMSAEEFSAHVVPTQLLAEAVVIDVYRYVTLKAERPSIPFEIRPRSSSLQEMSINRFQRIETRWGYSGVADRVKFQVDCPIVIKGFGIYTALKAEKRHVVKIELISSATDDVIASAERTIISTGTADPHRVYFTDPVDIQPDTLYTALLKLIGPDTYYGSKGLRRITHTIPNTSRCVTFQFAYQAGQNNGTSVDDGQIPEFIFVPKED